MPTQQTKSKTTAPKKPTASRSAIADVVAREYTINLHKRVWNPPPPSYHPPQLGLRPSISSLFKARDSRGGKTVGAELV